MTASQPATPGSDSVRAQIAEALEVHAYRGLVDVRFALEAIVPRVDRLRAEAKAEALEEAANEDSVSTSGLCVPGVAALRVVKTADLRARAAAYRTNPSEETQR